MPPGPTGRFERPHDAPSQALRGDGRAGWDRMLAWLRKSAQIDDPLSLSNEILAQHARFESALAREEPELVANQLLWNEDEREFSLWIEGAYNAFSRTASALLERLLPGGDGAPEPAAICMAALALATGGSGIKWSEIAGAGRRAVSVPDLQRVFSRADASAIAEAQASMPFLDEESSLTVTAHYARMRILDALCRGTLGRQQAAIVDCWLREWAPDYPIVPGPVAKAYLPVNSKSHRGMHAGTPSADGGHERVLLIEPMAGHIELVVRWFHDGRIYPGHGVASRLRVEEHVAVLDTLRGFLHTARRGLTERPPREGREAHVELYVGLAEILAKSFAFSADGGKSPVLGAALAPLPLAAASGPADSRKAIETQYEVARRTMRLLDESDGGLGLEGEEGAHALEAGTLIAVRRAPAELPLLCELVRRVAIPGTPTRFGARVLSGDMKSITLACEGKGAGVKALFVAGHDSSGRGDSIVVSSSDFDPEAIHEVQFADRVYRVRLNRLRHRGRGWVLAGLEVVDARDAGEAADFQFRE
jgi:hypothetical protein